LNAIPKRSERGSEVFRVSLIDQLDQTRSTDEIESPLAPRFEIPK